MPSNPEDPQKATIAALLAAAGRKAPAVPVRREFVQRGAQRSPQPGPLRDMVRRHDERALDLFLLHRALASSEPWDVARDGRVWGRALGLDRDDKDGGASAVSKAWARLEDTYRLVSRERSGRLARVTSLHESGTGTPYTSPSRGYFKLPFAYWTSDDEWYRTLSFAAKSVLLISLSLTPPFSLPAERAPEWYGMSADTMNRGQIELRRHRLLHREFLKVTNWTSPTGFTTYYKFRLLKPFSRRPADAEVRQLTAPAAVAS